MFFFKPIVRLDRSSVSLYMFFFPFRMSVARWIQDLLRSWFSPPIFSRFSSFLPGRFHVLGECSSLLRAIPQIILLFAFPPALCSWRFFPFIVLFHCGPPPVLLPFHRYFFLSLAGNYFPLSNVVFERSFRFPQVSLSFTLLRLRVKPFRLSSVFP